MGRKEATVVSVWLLGGNGGENIRLKVEPAVGWEVGERERSRRALSLSIWVEGGAFCWVGNTTRRACLTGEDGGFCYILFPGEKWNR